MIVTDADPFYIHLELLGAMFIPLLVFWLDLRHKNGTNHIENVQRLTSIETKVTPLSDHWNRKGPW